MLLKQGLVVISGHRNDAIEQLQNEIEDFEVLQNELVRLQAHINNTLQQFEIPVGLTPARIGKFYHFKADKTFNGKRCICCMDDFQVGRMLVRLDCNHVLCKICTDICFQNNKT